MAIKVIAQRREVKLGKKLFDRILCGLADCL